MTQPDELQQRLTFLSLREADRELLARLRPALEKHADRFVATFYRHLLSFEATRDLLRDPEVKERLLSKQHDYLLSLAGPRFDADFLAERRRIGETHARVGLEPRWYLGAYSLYLSVLTPVIVEECGGDPRRAGETLIALGKLLMLDAQIAMETYIERQERELEHLTRELAREGRRLARDYQDQSAELRATVSRARAAEELASVATLVAGLAHEIGTPMGVIQGHAKLLESSIEGEQALWRLRTIQEQIGRISKIIQTLLNIARPGASQRVPVPLGSLIETSLAFVGEKLARRNIRVRRNVEDGASVSGDPERLQQLLLNLFLNAADAMPDGGELAVTLSQDGDQVEICVTDTGVGIPGEQLERIFDPFFTTKEAGQGSGLGLMVSKGIVSDHGGTLEVTSRPGSGTRFCISLPRDGGGPAAEPGGAG